MRGKIVLAVVLCLVAAAALGIGAAPALAASGCTCHTAVPPTGGAPAAHAPLVVGVTDCTTCHKGMTVPHPALVKPTLYVGKPHADGLGTNVHGGLSRPWLPLAGVVVYLQTREPTGTVYTDAGKLETDVRGFYVFELPLFTNLIPRTISQGLAGPPVVMPAISVPTVAGPTPTLTLGLSGLTRGAVRLGHTVSMAGKVTPTDMAGQNVRLTVQRWLVHQARWPVTGDSLFVNRTITATGAYSWKYTPKHPGLYRVQAKIANTSAYNAAITDWRRFRVN